MTSPSFTLVLLVRPLYGGIPLGPTRGLSLVSVKISCDYRLFETFIPNSVGDNVLIFIHWLLKMFKKEHDLLSRYERNHPHFIRYLALDAVVTVAIVLGIFQTVSSGSSPALTPTGVSVVSSADLVNQVKAAHINAYWLGPISGYKYTLNTQIEGIADIFYWPGDSGNRNANQFLYEVKTYKDQKIWDAHTHTILAMANTSTIAVKKGLSIKINRASMKGVIATFADKKEILAIAYPTPQTLDSMIKNVESLRLVR